jgi:PEP-CTERM motif
MKTKLRIAAAALFAFAAFPAMADTLIDDPLHGFCAAGCTDNGTNTPITSNPPVNFGWTVSPGNSASGTMLVDILVPDNLAVTAANAALVTISGSTIAGGSTNFSLVSTTPWTSGFLADYLGITASPTNGIGAYLPATQALLGFPAGLNGFFVLQANIGTQNLNGPSGPFTPTFSLNEGAQGMYLVAFLSDTANSFIATANSGALFETTSGNTITPVIAGVPEPSTWAMMILGFVGLAFAFRQRRRMIGFAA